MEFHPAANIFPMMTGDDYRALVESISRNGYDSAFPILTFEGMILDGRNRYTACLELGIEPAYQEWRGDDPWEFVWLANSERRHLTQIQKALIKKRQLEGQSEWLEARNERRERIVAGIPTLVSDDTRVPAHEREREALAREAGVSPATAARAQSLDNARPDLADKVIAGAITPAQAEAQRRRDEAEELHTNPVPPPAGKYATIVVDPPWPMQKIEREVAPNQYAFDYPVMTIEDIAQLRILDDCADDQCHLFLWTTQKFLPDAFYILDCWGFKYVFEMVWHKNGGFQPYNLPQYNCEFILYARRGSPQFLETKAFNTCFNADRNGHSVKPDEFYELLERVCPGPRIEIFARQKRGGFDTWGNEA